jgi:hypothetical protein
MNVAVEVFLGAKVGRALLCMRDNRGMTKQPLLFVQCSLEELLRQKKQGRQLKPTPYRQLRPPKKTKHQLQPKEEIIEQTWKKQSAVGSMQARA